MTVLTENNLYFYTDICYNNLRQQKEEVFILTSENILPFYRKRSLQSLLLWYNNLRQRKEEEIILMSENILPF